METCHFCSWTWPPLSFARKQQSMLIPAQAGTQESLLDSQFLGNDTQQGAGCPSGPLCHCLRKQEPSAYGQMFPNGLFFWGGGGKRRFFLVGLEELLVGGHGQPVAPFVFRMAHMAGDMPDADLMSAGQLVQPLP